MASKTDVIWIEPPSRMARALDQYGDRVIKAVIAVADFMATKMQNAARQNAPWEDRTGNARTGLFSVTRVKEAAKEIVAIYLSHGSAVFYGKFLELIRGGKYAIIMPTIEQHLSELKRLLDDLFR